MEAGVVIESESYFSRENDNVDDSDDLFSSTYIKLWRILSKYEIALDSNPHYLYWIRLNVGQHSCGGMNGLDWVIHNFNPMW